MLEEHRKFTRVPFKVSADLAMEGSTLHSDSIDDLSLGGCRLPIRIDPAIGAECQISIFLTGSSDNISVRMNGKIVRSDDDSVSVEFISIDAESEMHLRNIILYNSNDPKRIEQEIRRHRDNK